MVPVRGSTRSRLSPLSWYVSGIGPASSAFTACWSGWSSWRSATLTNWSTFTSAAASWGLSGSNVIVLAVVAVHPERAHIGLLDVGVGDGLADLVAPHRIVAGAGAEREGDRVGRSAVDDVAGRVRVGLGRRHAPQRGAVDRVARAEPLRREAADAQRVVLLDDDGVTDDVDGVHPPLEIERKRAPWRRQGQERRRVDEERRGPGGVHRRVPEGAVRVGDGGRQGRVEADVQDSHPDVVRDAPGGCPGRQPMGQVRAEPGVRAEVSRLPVLMRPPAAAASRR